MIEIRMIIKDIDNQKSVEYFSNVKKIEFKNYGIAIFFDNRPLFYIFYDAMLDAGIYLNGRCIGHLCSHYIEKEGEKNA